MNRTLVYLRDDLSEHVILDDHYRLMTVGQNTVSVIRLELKALVLATRTLEDFSPFFSIHEHLAMALCLCEQWETLKKETALAQAEHSILAQHTCMVGYLNKEEKIAQIVGISSKHTLLQGIENYKKGSLDKGSLHKGERTTAKAAPMAELPKSDPRNAMV